MISVFVIKRTIKRVVYFFNNLWFYGRNKFIVSEIVKQQRADFTKIPIIIINYNQLHFLKQLIERLKPFGFKKIVILDNASTYPALLEYYDTLSDPFVVERLQQNYGHLALYKNKSIFEKYCKGYYALTDADIVPSPKLPPHFLKTLMQYLHKYSFKNKKAGFALDCSDLTPQLKERPAILKWEAKHWDNELEPDVYDTDIDTTFALYWPGYHWSWFSEFTKGIRIAGDFTAKHGGWYLHEIPPEERMYYYHKNISSSWLLNDDGELIKNENNRAY